MTDPSDFLRSKLEAYAAAVGGSYCQFVGQLPQDEKSAKGFDYPGFVQVCDPAIIKGEFEAAIRFIGSDLIASYNDAVGTAGARNEVARELSPKYLVAAAEQLAFENALRQSMGSVYSALGDLANARLTYQNFAAGSHARALGSASTVASFGAAIGGMLVPGIGHAVGALVGGAWAGNRVDQQSRQLLVDFLSRVELVTSSLGAAFEMMVTLVSQQFEALYGQRLNALAHEIEQRSRMGAAPRGSLMASTASPPVGPHQAARAGVSAQHAAGRWALPVIAIALAILAAVAVVWMVRSGGLGQGTMAGRDVEATAK